jgi:hypothetical protein
MRTSYIIAGGVVAAAVAYFMWKGPKSVGYEIGSGAVDFVDGVVTGTVETIGEAVGIPKTNKTQCEIDKANGDTWNASFSCPASDFLSYLWS